MNELDIRVNHLESGMAQFAITQRDQDTNFEELSYSGVIGRKLNVSTHNGKMPSIVRMFAGDKNAVSDDSLVVLGQGEWSPGLQESFFSGGALADVVATASFEPFRQGEIDQQAEVDFDRNSLSGDCVQEAIIFPSPKDERTFMFSFVVSPEPLVAALSKEEAVLVRFVVSAGGKRTQSMLFVVSRELFDGTGLLGRLDPTVVVH